MYGKVCRVTTGKYLPRNGEGVERVNNMWRNRGYKTSFIMINNTKTTHARMHTQVCHFGLCIKADGHAEYQTNTLTHTNTIVCT